MNRWYLLKERRLWASWKEFS